jgi:hypothetical protein
MGTSPNSLPCDGCALTASPQHIAERLRRLELCTRFRPVHMSVLFVALAPPVRPEDDYYGPAESKEFFDPFLDALEIASSKDIAATGSDNQTADTARLMEFQRRGYYLAYVSECPIGENEEPVASTITRLAPTLIRRIRFNYQPKYIAPLGNELYPLVDLFAGAGIGHLLILDQGLTWPMPRTGDREWVKLFHGAMSTAALRDNLSSGYDRIELKQVERKSGAGGNS